MSDFTFADHGSICILTAETQEARVWVLEHLPDDRQTWGSNGTVVEPRYAGDILSGLTADGLTVEEV